MAQIWDIQPLLAGDSSIQTTPKPLANHPTDAAPVTCNFQTRERGERETIVAGAVESPNGLSIHVFTFIFGEKEDQGFIAKDLCRTPPLDSMRWPSLGIYGDVALVIGSSHETGFLTIILLDYRRQALYVMDSGILYHEEMSFEAFIHENDLITYTPNAEGVVFSIWVDALGLLKSPIATSWSTIHTYSVPPDSSKVWFFEKRCQFPECELWYPSRPWNTPSPRTFGLIPSHLTADWAVDVSNFAPEGSNQSRSILCPFVTPCWLEPAHVTRLMKDDGPLPPAYRTALPLRTTSFWPSLDEAFPLMTPSSCGQHMVWVTSGGTDLDPQNESVYPDVQLIHLPSAEDHSNRTAAVPYASRLVLPLDLNKVHRIDFCDETGLLAVICLGDLPSSPQVLHVFRY
ncbi:hypothetical protein FS837_010088 [Tulasnella sp. UAMH 9824]|nr:hypothetical protein FS837_010088 [Tulasnella sp. UAMH 9824]